MTTVGWKMSKFSNYNFTYQRCDSTWVVCNTFSGSIVILENDEYEQYFVLKKIPQVAQSVLLSNGILIDDSRDQEDELRRMRMDRKQIKSERYIRILTTTGCNARCPYCFEKGIAYETMDHTTAQQVADYILYEVNLLRLSKLYIHWFGGEPLLNKSVIYTIMDKLVARLENIDFRTYFTTNGSLINDSIVANMKKLWNTKWVQISLDGVGDAYNQMHNYINPQLYNYDVVINNIKKLICSGVRVNLCLKYYPHCIDSLYDMVARLKTDLCEQMASNFLYIYPAPIFSVKSPRNNISIKESADTSYVRAISAMQKWGIHLPDNILEIKLKTGECYACTNGGIAISPKGEFYKCALAAKDKSAVVGNIKDGIQYNSAYKKWVTEEIPSECKKCIFLPICQGGCRAGYLGYAEFGCYRNKLSFKDVVEYQIQKLTNTK